MFSYASAALECSCLVVIGSLNSGGAILPFLLLNVLYTAIQASSFEIIIRLNADSCVCLCWMGVLFLPFLLLLLSSGLNGQGFSYLAGLQVQ